MVCGGAVELGLSVHNEGASSDFLGLSEGAARVMLHLILLAAIPSHSIKAMKAVALLI
jgi:hypothetical protein